MYIWDYLCPQYYSNKKLLNTNFDFICWLHLGCSLRGVYCVLFCFGPPPLMSGRFGCGCWKNGSKRFMLVKLRIKSLISPHLSAVFVHRVYF